ncbi:hypothetical protein IJH15_03375 [Candidatus Saccharibacteria bacterium]|nr:hypothetical protein [Candidatus Saccharibacteria bacterium]
MATISWKTIRTLNLLRAIADTNNNSMTPREPLRITNNITDEQFSDLVKKLQSSLPIEEALIVVAYFGLHIGDRLSFDEIRIRYGYTSEQINDMVARALKRLDFESFYKPLSTIF